MSHGKDGPNLKEEADARIREMFGDVKPRPAPAPAPTGGVVTVKDLDALVEQIFDQRSRIEEMDALVSKEQIELTRLKQLAVTYLKELEREDYKSARGTISVQQKWRVNMPQTDEDKAALFKWMQEQGIYDKYATVNSQALNSLFMAEWEAAKKRGEGMEFALPGIGQPKLFEDLGMRKK